jgi:hypothetical protein
MRMPGAPQILAQWVLHVVGSPTRSESMLAPPNITVGRTIRRMPAKHARANLVAEPPNDLKSNIQS